MKVGALLLAAGGAIVSASVLIPDGRSPEVIMQPPSTSEPHRSAQKPPQPSPAASAPTERTVGPADEVESERRPPSAIVDVEPTRVAEGQNTDETEEEDDDDCPTSDEDFPWCDEDPPSER